MDKKICLKCSTENEGNYVFCKYCGAMLPVVDKRYSYPQEEASTDRASEPEIGGVSLNEMSLYVGKRPHKFIPKFIRMEASNQNVSFCIPVFLFGLFFGFFGTAIWFFWRKMPKLGSIFVVLGLIITGADLAVNYTAYSSYIDGIFGLYSDIFRDPASYSDPNSINAAVNSLTAAFEQSFNPAVSLISRYVGNLMVPSVVSLFAMYLYKNKAVSDIKRIKASPEGAVPLETRISLKGGCSGLLVLIPIFADVLANFSVFIVCVL